MRVDFIQDANGLGYYGFSNLTPFLAQPLDDFQRLLRRQLADHVVHCRPPNSPAAKHMLEAVTKCCWCARCLPRSLLVPRKAGPGLRPDFASEDATFRHHPSSAS